MDPRWISPASSFRGGVAFPFGGEALCGASCCNLHVRGVHGCAVNQLAVGSLQLLRKAFLRCLSGALDRRFPAKTNAFQRIRLYKGASFD